MAWRVKSYRERIIKHSGRGKTSPGDTWFWREEEMGTALCQWHLSSCPFGGLAVLLTMKDSCLLPTNLPFWASVYWRGFCFLHSLNVRRHPWAEICVSKIWSFFVFQRNCLKEETILLKVVKSVSTGFMMPDWLAISGPLCLSFSQL